MEPNQNIEPENVPQSAEVFGTMLNHSEGFRTVPQPSETFGKLPHNAERFRSIPHVAERQENHTLTVREVVRLFEAAGVARTERSIVNWCQPNRTGLARLAAYYDPNERKYFITLQSVELAIEEEKAKAAKLNDAGEPFRTLPQPAETPKQSESVSENETGRLKELERENLDLKITNRAKDMAMERMQNERDGFFEKLLAASRQVGVLETKLLQIESSPGSQN